MTSQVEVAVDIGLSLEKLIASANSTFQGMISACYTSTVTCVVMVVFQCTHLGAKKSTEKCKGVESDEDVQGIESGEDEQGMESDEEIRRWIMNIAYVFATLMYLTRLYFLMESGQKLAVTVKKAKRLLEDVMLCHQKNPLREPEQFSNTFLILQKRLEVYQLIHPISPYSVFNLSSKTFYSTLAMTFTYIVILIKVRNAM